MFRSDLIFSAEGSSELSVQCRTELTNLDSTADRKEALRMLLIEDLTAREVWGEDTLPVLLVKAKMAGLTDPATGHLKLTRSEAQFILRHAKTWEAKVMLLSQGNNLTKNDHESLLELIRPLLRNKQAPISEVSVVLRLMADYGEERDLQSIEAFKNSKHLGVRELAFAAIREIEKRESIHPQTRNALRDSPLIEAFRKAIARGDLASSSQGDLILFQANHGEFLTPDLIREMISVAVEDLRPAVAQYLVVTLWETLPQEIRKTPLDPKIISLLQANARNHLRRLIQLERDKKLDAGSAILDPSTLFFLGIYGGKQDLALFDELEALSYHFTGWSMPAVLNVARRSLTSR